MGRHLYAVLNRIREYGLSGLKAVSVQAAKADILWAGVQPSGEKVAAIRNAEPPQNPSEVRSFLSLVQYSSKFLPDFAEVPEPLQKLMRTEQHFVWGTAQRNSFAKRVDI